MDANSNAAASLSLTSTERGIVTRYALVLSLRMLGLFVLLPVLALFAIDLPGATPLLAGLAVGAFGLTQALFQVPAGLLSDRIGRKPIILFGLLIFAAGSILAAMSDTITGVLAGRVLQGAGAISAAVTALVADQTRDTVRTRAMAVIGISIGMSFMLALALGPTLSAVIGVSGLFWLGAVLAVVAAVLVVSAPGGWKPVSAPRRGGWQQSLANRRLLPLHFGIFSLHAMLTATFVAVPFLLRDSLEVAASTHSYIYLVALAASLAGTVPLIIAVERSGKPTAIFLLAIGLLALGQLGLLAANSTVWVMAMLAVFFAGFNFLEARMPAQVSQLAGEQGRGGALGVFATSQFSGAFVGGLSGGALMGWVGPTGIFIAAATLATVWAAIAAWSADQSTGAN